MDSGDDTFVINNQTQLPLTVVILIFDQVEVLDVAGPFDGFAKQLLLLFITIMVMYQTLTSDRTVNL